MPENTDRITVEMPKTKFSIRGLLWRIGMFLFALIVLLWFATSDSIWSQIVAGAVGVVLVIPAFMVILAGMAARAFRADVDAQIKRDAKLAEERTAQAREARGRFREGFEPGPSFMNGN